MTVNEPLVSVVTPVYNGAAYLAECIESVRAQTYANWEYVIVDNCSTDATQQIARQYAAYDARIRVSVNDKLLPLLANWNHALRQISPASRYVKIVHADDWLFPECVERMVCVAEENPSVGIVGAYRLEEDKVTLDGLPYPSTVVSGREIGRWNLLGRPYLFGSPTSIMVRADLVRGRRNFYNEDNLHADTEVCLDLLRSTDFGFVHQVLTFTRRHNESVTSTCKRLNTYLPSALYVLHKYGGDYLDRTEYEQMLKYRLQTYYRFLGASVLQLRKKDVWRRRHEFWTYHAKTLRDLGHPLGAAKLIAAAFVALYNLVLEKLHVA